MVDPVGVRETFVVVGFMVCFWGRYTSVCLPVLFVFNLEREMKHINLEREMKNGRLAND